MPENQPLAACVRECPTGSVITIRVAPRSGSTMIAGARQGALVVRVAAAPVDGAANDALTAFLARRLKLPKHRVRITGGLRSRTKRVTVSGLSADDVRSRLPLA